MKWVEDQEEGDSSFVHLVEAWSSLEIVLKHSSTRRPHGSVSIVEEEVYCDVAFGGGVSWWYSCSRAVVVQDAADSTEDHWLQAVNEVFHSLHPYSWQATGR